MRFFFEKYKELLYSTSKNLTIIYILFLLLKALNLSVIDWYINFDILFFIAIIIDTTAIIYYFNLEKNTEKINDLIKYSFFVFLLTIGISKFGSLSDYLFSIIPKSHIFILTTILGIFTIWKNKGIIEDIGDEENKNNLKWFQNNKLYSMGLMVILLVVVIILTYKIGQRDFWEDEFPVVDAAGGLYYEGTFYKWDWLKGISGEFTDCTQKDPFCEYKRAWPHTVLVSLSYKIFGISTWSSRIVSVIFGILFIIISYFFVENFTKNKLDSLIIPLILSLYYNYIIIFRYTRMYSIFITINLTLFYLIFQFLMKTSNLKIKNKKVDSFIKRFFNFKIELIPILIFLFFLSYQTHINSLIILPITFIFLIYLTTKEFETKYLITVIIGSVFIIITFFLATFMNYFKDITQFISFFSKRNYIYLDYLFGYPFPKEMGIILIILGIFFINIIKNKDLKNKLIYLYSITLFSVVFFVYIANRYSGFSYISNIASVSIILTTYLFLKILKICNSKILKITLFSLLIILTISSFCQKTEYIYEQKIFYSEAYSTIVKNYKPNDVIFGQYLKKYYLKELGNFKVVTVDMMNNKLYTYESFIEDLKKYDSGWIVWDTGKTGHLKREIIDYSCKNFEHLHGEICNEKIDDTKVEVFYFDKNMIG